MRLSILFLLLFSFTIANAQDEEAVKSNKGKIYAFWGWNRGWYSNSDIHFTGDNYDFKLNDVRAQDRQSTFGLDPYFNPSRVTIPQTNFRIGYFINDHIDISFGVDHMKYIMPNDQVVGISGEINDNSNYDGTYNNDEIKLEKNFLFFEHSDGLNYLNVEITRNDDLLKLSKINMNPNKVQINTLIGFGLGPLMPKSNVTLWNNERNDEFHFAGYGFAAKIGLNVTFFKFLFFRGELKEGFIDMSDIRTSPDPSDTAKQHFFFTQANFVFGIAINPFN
ncbi:MAG: hypothetical protein JKX68_01325 [Flavobacteriales bacterium]|nr:hypothetical protein [Flavobacteriales bacterium]